MNKRYQVFVSSTYDDLKEERNRVIQALLNINCIPCGMEYFPAADEDAWHCIERLIPECDYYVLILAGMYGSIPVGKQKSYTHLEYELAVKHKIPVPGPTAQGPVATSRRTLRKAARAATEARAISPASGTKIMSFLGSCRSAARRIACELNTANRSISAHWMGARRRNG